MPPLRESSAYAARVSKMTLCKSCEPSPSLVLWFLSINCSTMVHSMPNGPIFHNWTQANSCIGRLPRFRITVALMFIS